LWDRATTLAFFGGINVSTLYRGMRSKRYPRPIFVSNNAVRWLADECEDHLRKMIEARDGRKQVTRRGRPRRPVAADKTETAA
jgi:predicted DNA-binding transcriptional regulator AlpA